MIPRIVSWGPTLCFPQWDILARSLPTCCFIHPSRPILHHTFVISAEVVSKWTFPPTEANTSLLRPSEMNSFGRQAVKHFVHIKLVWTFRKPTHTLFCLPHKLQGEPWQRGQYHRAHLHRRKDIAVYIRYMCFTKPSEYQRGFYVPESTYFPATFSFNLCLTISLSHSHPLAFTLWKWQGEIGYLDLVQKEPIILTCSPRPSYPSDRSAQIPPCSTASSALHQPLILLPSSSSSSNQAMINTGLVFVPSLLPSLRVLPFHPPFHLSSNI